MPLFGSLHLTTLAIGFSLVAAMLVIGRRGEKPRRVIVAILIVLNLGACIYSQFAWRSMGKELPLEETLPFHLCDLCAIVAGIALMTRRTMLCALTYYWGLAGTFQALLTPALGAGYPSWPFFSFFVQHFAIVAAALFIPIVNGWRPPGLPWKTPLQVFGLSVVYQMSSLAINLMLDTNFGFTRHAPEKASIIDHFGPWPWYLLTMWPLAIGLFMLLSLPFMGKKQGPDAPDASRLIPPAS